MYVIRCNAGPESLDSRCHKHSMKDSCEGKSIEILMVGIIICPFYFQYLLSMVGCSLAFISSTAAGMQMRKSTMFLLCKTSKCVTSIVGFSIRSSKVVLARQLTRYRCA